jgi:hypothetical protein
MLWVLTVEFTQDLFLVNVRWISFVPSTLLLSKILDIGFFPFVEEVFLIYMLLWAFAERMHWISLAHYSEVLSMNKNSSFL